ncbi:MAG: fructose bisphosphate aldolase, partial [Pseudomonadota bacterium]
MPHPDHMAKIKAGQGFIAALDQSGGSTPKALALYGVGEDAYTNDIEMFDQIHAMRSRIINAPAFYGDKVIGAILFEDTMDRQINGQPTAATLWMDHQVVPFLKVDKGLQDPADGVRLMKPMPELDDLLSRAVSHGVFGTKMRSVIDAATPTGIAAIVDQQFDVGHQILRHGLVPILEPEVTISIADKAQAESLLRDAILAKLDDLNDDQDVMLKLTLPEIDNHYKPLIDHPRVVSVVALSGGYTRADANGRLSRQTGMIASFSRALTEGLSAEQKDDDFNAVLSDT